MSKTRSKINPLKIFKNFKIFQNFKLYFLRALEIPIEVGFSECLKTLTPFLKWKSFHFWFFSLFLNSSYVSFKLANS